MSDRSASTSRNKRHHHSPSKAGRAAPNDRDDKAAERPRPRRQSTAVNDPVKLDRTTGIKQKLSETPSRPSSRRTPEKHHNDVQSNRIESTHSRRNNSDRSSTYMREGNNTGPLPETSNNSDPDRTHLHKARCRPHSDTSANNSTSSNHKHVSNKTRPSSAPAEPVSLPQDKLIFHKLSSKYSPKTSNKRRLIVIGDVHGMYTALKTLLERVEYKQSNDHLIFVGDLVTRGKEGDEGSFLVLDHAIKHKASVIRGNHEDMLLNVGVMKRNPKWSEDTSESIEGFVRHGKKLRTPKEEEERLYNGSNEHDPLTEEQERFLEAMPHLLDLGNVGGYNRMIVAHAGINPYLDFSKQDPTVVMNVKSVNPDQRTCSWLGRLDKEGKEISVEKKGLMVPWYKKWNEIQNEKEEIDRTAIIFGHNAKEGFRRYKYSFGIDTGVHRPSMDQEKPTGMGMLTALIIDVSSCKMIQVKSTDLKNGY